MTEETETPDEKAFERFRRLKKKVVSVPKSEADRRAEEWREGRKTETSRLRRNNFHRPVTHVDKTDQRSVKYIILLQAVTPCWANSLGTIRESF